MTKKILGVHNDKIEELSLTQSLLDVPKRPPPQNEFSHKKKVNLALS